MTSLYLIAIFALLMVWQKTRKFAIYFLPWLIFAVTYDSMRFYPNYMVGEIDVRDLYEAEKSLFGIAAQTPDELMAVADHSHMMIPGEYFRVNHHALADLLAGFFYLCWVPVPVGFALYLFFKKEYRWFVRFSWTFLAVNLIGFVGYYIHPASPPWYVMEYGFTPILGTPGNVAGLARFDALVGIPVFHSIYCHNANVFAAVPSLHAAYMLITTIYAAMSHRRWFVTTAFACICMGIWWTAVYSGHHYIIDVLLGILTALLGIVLMEKFVFQHFMK